jgi:hypothetical protein
MTKTASPKRFTFTFSNSSGLGVIINSLEQRLKGLSRAEIVKLALVEFNHHLEYKDKILDEAIWLSEEEENSLAMAMESESVMADTSGSGALRNFLDNAKKKYA